MNRKAFYDSIRPKLNLTTENVAGTEFLLDRLEEKAVPLDDASDILATCWWETGQRMQPIDEYGSDAYFNARYGPQTAVGKELGNTEPGDGARFHGRGYPQTTGRHNYQHCKDKLGVDFIGNPELMKVPINAWNVMYLGMTEGWFTGKGLADYIDTDDDLTETDAESFAEYVNARRIINGTDKASTIANIALTFEHGLRTAGYGSGSPAEPVPVPPAPITAPTPPKPPQPAPVTQPTTIRAILAAIVNFILGLFRRKGS